VTSILSPLQPIGDERTLTGWGRTAPSVSRVAPVATADEVVALIQQAPRRGILARGLGRSYGDAAQSGGAVVLDTSRMSTIDLDTAGGTVTAGAGASLDDILRLIVPAGYFVPVTPGTRMVTVGGAIAADVHGKNHHVDGSFGQHVTAMTVVDGSGAVRELKPNSRGANREAFWATIGGMGLTGVITEATFDLIPISSAYISVDTERASDLDDVMARMIERDDDYRYSVAWIDSVHPSGRGVITRGDHAPEAALAAHKRQKARHYEPKVLGTAPSFVPSGLLNTTTVRAFNEAWFRKNPKSETGALHSIGAFFHPLDGVQEWNRIYGPGGFVQYQFVVPDEREDLVPLALRKLREVGAPSFLTVLKRFGAANPAPLSFPQPGWTLAVDVPARIPRLAQVLDELDEQVADAGGRLYLAKDSRQSPEMFARTYPRLAEWQAVRARMDPHGIFTSDLGRRLEL
jgi:decaprenylphospho-beta-D-ribofuranose 2-oxidase